MPARLTCWGDRDADVRWLVAHALGKLGKPEAVEPLISRLHDAEW